MPSGFGRQRLAIGTDFHLYFRLRPKQRGARNDTDGNDDRDANSPPFIKKVSHGYFPLSFSLLCSIGNCAIFSKCALFLELNAQSKIPIKTSMLITVTTLLMIVKFMSLSVL
jgi:hypothetical protein